MGNCACGLGAAQGQAQGWGYKQLTALCVYTGRNPESLFIRTHTKSNYLPSVMSVSCFPCPLSHTLTWIPSYQQPPLAFGTKGFDSIALEYLGFHQRTFVEGPQTSTHYSAVNFSQRFSVVASWIPVSATSIASMLDYNAVAYLQVT